MAKIELQGFDEYLRKVQKLADKSEPLCKKTVYSGAGILADKMRDAVDSLPTISDGEALSSFKSGKVMSRISYKQKKGLQESLGISTIRKERSGMVQTAVGFTGYNEVKTKHFPNGQPNAEVARSLEKGTSYLKRNRFVENTIKANKSEIIDAMSEAADDYIERIMEGD